jgi:hypothetical protein
VALLACMLDKLYKETDDRIVIVSNYTQVSQVHTGVVS